MFKQSKSQDHYDKYSSLRKSLKSLVKSKMSSNFDDDLSPNAITKIFWSYVKSSNKSSRIPEKMFLGDCYRKNSKGIADLFSKHFCNQFSDESHYDIDISFSNDTFINFSISTDTIYRELSNLNPNKSTGPDNISGQLLKNCARSRALPLQLLFNLSFKTGSIPSEWKLAHIVPIHKKENKNNVQNYRPISLTCIISKVLEKCIRDEILLHCPHLLNDSQHGFLPLRSCTTQLVPFAHDISLGLNSNHLMDIIYFDFAKAFDTVNHDIILQKLKDDFKIDGLMLKFIKEYLEGRQQRVMVNGVLSDLCTVKSGVPQGSILGPLLFVLFIDNMQNCVSSGTKIALYADDTKIWRHIDSPKDHCILQNDINALYQWSVKNKMRFHIKKCKVLSINHFNKNLFSELPFYLYPYDINDILLDYCDEEMDLGIVTTKRFNFNNHRSEILSKAVTKFILLRRTCHFVRNPQKRRTLYLTLIRSLFEHGSQVWSPVNTSTIISFENFQKSCIKWILREQFLPYHEIDYLKRLTALNILPLESKFIYSDLLLFHKVIHELIPIKIPDEITTLSARTRSTIQSSHKYQIKSDISIKKNALSNSFFIRSLSHWNRLPDECRQLQDHSAFRVKVLDYLWSLVENRVSDINNNPTSTLIDREPD